MVSMTLSDHSYMTRETLWRELDALGEDQVRLRLAQGAYPDRTRVLVEEWLHEQAARRSLIQDAYRAAPAAGFVEPLRIERRDDKITIVAATAAAIAAFMATIAATVSVLVALQPVTP